MTTTEAFTVYRKGDRWRERKEGYRPYGDARRGITPAFNCRRLSRRRAPRAFAVALQGAQSRWLP
jgi:hypothetical protein